MSYAEDDDDELDSDIEEQRRQNQIKKDSLPAFEDPSQFDDEVERVITHKWVHAGCWHHMQAGAALPSGRLLNPALLLQVVLVTTVWSLEPMAMPRVISADNSCYIWLHMVLELL